MTSRAWRWAIPVAALGGALGACSLLVPLDDVQCSTNGDCTSRGGAFTTSTCVNNVCVGRTIPPTDDSGPDVSAADAGVDAGEDAGDPEWACLGQPGEVIPPSTQTIITFNVFDALSAITTAGPQGGSDFTVLSSTGVPGISVQGCNPGDPLCNFPVTTPLQFTDDAGEATVTVTRDFNGFFQFAAPNFVPSKLYPGQMQADASTFAPPVALLQIGEIEALASALKVDIDLGADASVGQLFFQAYDCFDRHAPGVTFSISVDGGPNSVQWYSRGVTPSTTVTDTDSLGAGGQVNVPTGAILVTATLSGTTTVLGNANVLVTGGGASFVWVRVRTH
jgi:hypothetical protein